LKLSFSKIVVKKILYFAYIATIGSISYTLINSFNVINLKKYFNSNYISYYSSADMLSSVFIVLPLALNAFLTNRLSQIIDFNIKLKLFLKLIFIYIFCAFIILIFFYIYGNSIIHLVFGDKMLKSNEILLTMSISSIIIGITLFLSQFYFALLDPKTPAIILTISAILMFFLSNHLVYKYNISGASLSLLFTSLFSLSLYIIFFVKLVIKKIK
jgi:O-antigen/teichoic acid export membrane protein